MTDFLGLRHTYQRRGHFLETRTQIHGPYHTAEELTAAYDRLAYLPNGIEVDRTAWPRFEEDAK